MSDKIKIVTHSSKFHTDDIFGVATLLLYLESQGTEVEVIRSRDFDVIENGDFVLDVGGIYDPIKKRFDHHQTGGAGTRDNGVPYASFGLIWKHYGQALSGSIEVARKVDETIVQPIDSTDNGIQFMKSDREGLYPFDVQLIKYTFEPTWKEDHINIDALFMQLVSYAKVFLLRTIKVQQDYAEGKEKVLEAYNSASDKRLIELDERYPWEETLAKFPEPLYVIYKKRIDNNWSIKCVANDFFLMTNRKLLPQSWAGKMNKELDNVTGVKDGVFCHNKRFMAVAKTREAVLKLAELALAE